MQPENDPKDTEKTDEEIILLYKAGDRGAFKILINKYIPPVYNFAARVGNRNDAPDIVQEIFIKVWKNIHRYDPRRSSFKTWIFTIARNTVTDFLRKKRSILFSDIEENISNADSFDEPFLDTIIDAEKLPDDALQKLEDKEFFEYVLRSLDPGDREILVLHYQEGMTFDQIGKILHKPLNTVKSSHHRAIARLRKMLE